MCFLVLKNVRVRKIFVLVGFDPIQLLMLQIFLKMTYAKFIVSHFGHHKKFLMIIVLFYLLWL